MKSFAISFLTSIVITAVMFVLFATNVIDISKIFPDNIFNQDNNENIVELPNMLNLTADEAQQMAAEFDVKMMLEEEMTDKVQAGVIIKQFPLPGFKVLKGDAVKLTVSKRDEEFEEDDMEDEDMFDEPGMDIVIETSITMPDLEELELNEAVIKLNDIGIDNITKDFEPSDNVKKGFITKYSPDFGEEIDNVDGVRLLISEGPSIKYATVPNLYNKSLAKAKQAIVNAKLKVGKITKVTDIDKGFDRIISQSIAKGKKVKQGTVINITLNGESEGDEW
ncbi:MAG: PASTA domain-containing protein [Candidatus Delongbacteria bacterium]|jgi:beta-lactam-binding protein with PASTA domain|nr:PASTA domain-containing protein [Candidatus Delongbacteria bacterium]